MRIRQHWVFERSLDYLENVDVDVHDEFLQFQVLLLLQQHQNKDYNHYSSLDED